MTKKIILFLLSFYGAALLGCEESSALPSNYANRVRAIAQTFSSIHAPLKTTPIKKDYYVPSGKKVKKASIHIEQLQEMENAFQAIEQFDWKHGQREDATALMKKGIRFALALNDANKLCSIANQYQQNNELITIFPDRPGVTLNFMKLIYGSLPGKPTVKGIEFSD